MKYLLSFAVLLLAGCMIRFDDIAPVPTDRNFTQLDCNALASEKARIEAGLNAQIKQHAPGTKKAVGELKGEAEAATAAIAVNRCAVAPVVVPANKPLHKA
jgi:hypothetical protein